MNSNWNPPAHYYDPSGLSGGLWRIALALALTLGLWAHCGYAYSSADPSSNDKAESVSDKPTKVDKTVRAEVCPRCGGEKAKNGACKKCNFPLPDTSGRFVPYGANSRATYDLKNIGRSNQRIDRSMRSLQKSLRDMNTSINRIRIYNRR